MTEVDRSKSLVKMLFWLLVSLGLISYVVYTYVSGQMIHWYYYSASVGGYAIDAAAFGDATPGNPARLAIVPAAAIEGRQAVWVQAGGRLPRRANGVISLREVKAGRRVSLDSAAQTISVMAPSEIKEQKGFKYKDTFKHKGIRTNPWSGLWNVALVLAVGLSLGLLAEGVTDFCGMKIEKIDHEIGH
jgi:hypothetical protein